MNEQSDTETLSGYVVDLACLRKYPQEERLERARAHTRDCALMGHCVESGYGLVGDDGRLALLDARATPLVVDVLQQSDREQGIRLQVSRRKGDHGMKTVQVHELNP